MKGRSTRPCPLTPEQGEKGPIIIIYYYLSSENYSKQLLGQHERTLENLKLRYKDNASIYETSSSWKRPRGPVYPVKAT